MRYLHILALLVVLPAAVHAQYITLWSDTSNRVAINIDRVWSYNAYEHSRWGAGLKYEHHYSQTPHAVAAEVYGGYGLADQHWKWGASVDWVTRRTFRARHIYVRAMYGLVPSGSRHAVGGGITNPMNYHMLYSARMSHAEQAAIGWSKRLSHRLTLKAEGVISFEQRLFDGGGLLYPPSYHSAYAPSTERFVEVPVWVNIGTVYSLCATVGYNGRGGGKAARYYARLLAEAGRSLDLGVTTLALRLQAGATVGTDGVPYTRLFDLGGSYGAVLYFNNTMLTLRPYQYTTAAFAMGNMRWQLKKPLFDLWSGVWQVGSSPKPFVAASAAWGTAAYIGNTADGLPLAAPERGVAEAAVGADALLRFGATEWGFAVAQGLWPRVEHTALLFTAAVAL